MFQFYKVKNTVMFIVLTMIIAITEAAPDRTVNGTIGDENVHINQNDALCNTPACVHAASSILKNMNPSINPCDNFYQFACGKFIEETVIPDSEHQVSIFSRIGDKLKDQLHLIISDEHKEDDLPVFKSMKSFYQLCMDTDKINKYSENDLREVLNSLGGWPVLEGPSWNETSFDWKKSVYESGKLGYSTKIFVDVDVVIDPSNSNRRIIQIDQASTEVPHEYLINDINDSVVKAYYEFMVDFADYLGADREQAKNELNDSLNFEIELAKISLSNEERRDFSELDNRTTLQQLETRYPGIPWTEYINEILAPYVYINQSEEIVIAVPSFLEELPKLIARTPKRVLANYACFRAIMQSAGNMGADVQALINIFQLAISGVSEEQPRWRKCFDDLSTYFYTAIGRLYIKHYFDKNAKTDAVILTQNIRNSLRQLIEQADWMDNATKLAALEKLDSMVAYIGYPEELENDEKMNEYYQNITLWPGSFLKSELKLKLFFQGKRILNLRKSVEETKWTAHSDVAETNAFYALPYNSIDFPAGILQGEFYNAERPNYMNYGAIGWFIGHEITHAFDDEGSQYDKNGNVANWWKNDTKEEYLKRAKCIIDQYGNYTVKEINMPLNGINTQGENIADNGGLKASYLAYDEWEKKNGREPQLPGLNYTPQQMFWISAANNWCNKMRPEMYKLVATSDPHAPAAFRVLGTMSNLPEFSKDFNCPLGSLMNPTKKCPVW